MDESPKQSWIKQQGSKEYMLYDSMYTKSKNS